MVDLADTFKTLGAQPWEKQEECYKTLLKLLGNVVNNPGEAKFRSVKKGNEAMKAKVHDCPGGSDVLRAAGFVEEDEAFVLPEGSVEAVKSTVSALQAHANARREDNIR